jgi:hypothetical protein
MVLLLKKPYFAVIWKLFLNTFGRGEELLIICWSAWQTSLGGFAPHLLEATLGQMEVARNDGLPKKEECTEL